MTSTLEPVIEPGADEVYVAEIESHARGPVRRVVAGVLDLWCATTGGTMELTRHADVVVRRRHDGVEELRLPTQDTGDSVRWLRTVRGQLAEMTAAEFRQQWGMVS